MSKRRGSLRPKALFALILATGVVFAEPLPRNPPQPVGSPSWSSKSDLPLPRLDASAISTPAGTAAGTGGPDVIVGDIYDVENHGSEGVIAAFSVGTISCNAGDEPALWISENNQHPVIAQNIYRLKNGRFEQIGQSWLKHGFAALAFDSCNFGCVNPGTFQLLGVGCSDPYSGSLNGSQENLGPRSEVNAFTGFFPYPPNLDPPASAITGRRMQAYVRDLDPAQQGGGQYFVEAQYVTADEALAGNHYNNASYRPINVSFNVFFNFWTINLTNTTRRTLPAIRAWKANEPSVVETNVQEPGVGRFHLAAKATDLGNGRWQYEYALHNLNSDRSAGAFSIPILSSAAVTNLGFHDVEYHSGEVFDGTNWPAVVSANSVTWSTTPHATNPRANALRWGTLYNFRFEVDSPPDTSVATIGLFNPGSPSSVTAVTIGPLAAGTDCNSNGVNDTLDVANGTSSDCNANLVPDECETFPPTPIRAARLTTGLNFPVFLTSPPGDSGRLFIVEQEGRIVIFTGGDLLPTPFLDISSLVSSGGELGLLSMVFDPDYAANGFFYVNYTNLAGNTVIARYTVSGNPSVANPASAVILKTIPQDFDNHKGGQLQFGSDGYLYVGMGDGGSGNDPFGRAQDSGNLLGKMLRLDVDAPPGYVPLDNPYVGPGLPLDEIWSRGWRNPWRFSFDRLTGDLYAADVGQGSWEEIDFEPVTAAGGRNYGWRCMEGRSCTGLSGCTCNAAELTPPILVYDHGEGCSVTGGYVYRGCRIPDLAGTYFYADYCANWIRSFRYVGATVTDERDWTTILTPPSGSIIDIVSFGEDADGELYIVSHVGEIYKIVPDTGGPVCGDGIREPPEECDDGNTAGGDGCDAECRLESGGSNNHCNQATTIAEGTFAFDNIGATTDGPAEPARCDFFGDPQIASDVWFCYTASCTGTATARLCGSIYDTEIAAYNDCTCPTSASAIACNDDACGLQSEINFPVSACGSYLLRVGGFNGAQGTGTLTVSCQPAPLVNDCNENAVEDSADIACGTSDDLNTDGIPDECQTGGDLVRGGQLYDRWWAELGVAGPTTDHPLWQYRPDQTSNPATGAATWRCKECHGWDYKGVDGQYGTGTHRTGFPGVLGSSLSNPELFALLKEPPNNGGGPGVPNGHGYGAVMSDADIADLMAFTLLGMVDGDSFIDPPTGEFLGDPALGETRYTTQGSIRCTVCHGADGTAINFGTFEDPEYLGTVAVRNPWEFLHKVRVAPPGAPMPSWLAGGGTNQGVADIGRYVQLNFPVDCVQDAQCDDAIACTGDSCDAAGRCANTPNHGVCPDDGLFCTGPAVCDGQIGCTSAGNPCTVPEHCNEILARCECDTPLANSVGGRYLEVTPQPSDSTIPMAIKVAPACTGAVAKYVGAPSGPSNVANLVVGIAQAAVLTPGQWGTVYVAGNTIIPEADYEVRADCQGPSNPALSSPAFVTTAIWGDTVGDFRDGAWEGPDGSADITDVTAILDTFRHAATAPPIHRVDIWGCEPNENAEIIDAVGALDGFRHIPFLQSTRCPAPCP